MTHSNFSEATFTNNHYSNCSFKNANLFVDIHANCEFKSCKDIDAITKLSPSAAKNLGVVMKSNDQPQESNAQYHLVKLKELLRSNDPEP